MSKRGRDTSYNPKRKILGPPRASSRLRQGGQVNYTDTDLVESDIDSEFTVCGSESGFGSVKVEVDTESVTFEESWTPNTFTDKASQVGQQFARITEENVQLQMARKSENHP